ncbi:hypothetical protein [Rhodococcus aetherivorans]|uniref:hypothetical protein n=1 Tax=Rhodococcus aetherivorans TaxID=191292 RepID=UPI00365038D2
MTLPVCGALIGLGLASSLTFGTVLLGVGGVAYFLVRRKKYAYASLGLIAVYLILSVPSISSGFSERITWQESGSTYYPFLPQTVAFRISVWEQYFLPLVEASPILGHGPIRDTDRVFGSVESMYILVLVVWGAIGLAAFLAVLACAWRETWVCQQSNRDSDDQVRAVSEGILVALAGLTVLMFIHPYLNDAGSSELLIVLLGLCAGYGGVAGAGRAGSAIGLKVSVR